MQRKLVFLTVDLWIARRAEAVKLSSRLLEIAPPENVGEDDTRVYADGLNFIPAIGDHED